MHCGALHNEQVHLVQLRNPHLSLSSALQYTTSPYQRIKSLTEFSCDKKLAMRACMCRCNKCKPSSPSLCTTCARPPDQSLHTVVHMHTYRDMHACICMCVCVCVPMCLTIIHAPTCLSHHAESDVIVVSTSADIALRPTLSKPSFSTQDIPRE